MEEKEFNLLEEEGPRLVLASLAKRLVNYLVDIFLAAFVMQFVLAALEPRFPAYIKKFQSPPFDLVTMLSIWLFISVFLSLQEAILKGKTVGKLITGTRAVREDGSRISTETAFLRSIIRMVPFEAFSIFFLGRPWHDAWSRTFVIDERQSQ